MIRLAAVALVVLFAYACKQTYIVPQPPKQDTVVLLPDPETQTVGRAIVSSPNGGTTELNAERAVTQVAKGQAPAAPWTMMDAEVRQMFSEAMAARPLAPRHFLLYFLTDTATLTPESEALLKDILDFVKSRPSPDVTVIGHTDTTHTARYNFVLGMSRATGIRDRLVATGLDTRLVAVASHGEADLLVRTADNTDEQKNRRVEVSVR